MTNQQAELRAELEHMFASAWQDGVHHLNPKYLRRDTLFTDRAIELINAYTNKQSLELLYGLFDQRILARDRDSRELSDPVVPLSAIEAERDRLKAEL